MSNHARRRRSSLSVPRSQWPIRCQMAAVGRADDLKGKQEALQATHDRLVANVGGQRHSEVRWATYDAVAARAALADLGLLEQADQQLLDFLDLSPLGQLIVAYCDVEPKRYVLFERGAPWRPGPV